ncbi:hypothetical protein K438DRAFT_250698 [Mycena galopus ATCC 62051]|nr:hypothetical protein K438DRAFT_250698 [Mycena galopus ATCC 62051]
MPKHSPGRKKKKNFPPLRPSLAKTKSSSKQSNRPSNAKSASTSSPNPMPWLRVVTFSVSNASSSGSVPLPGTTQTAGWTQRTANVHPRPREVVPLLSCTDHKTARAVFVVKSVVTALRNAATTPPVAPPEEEDTDPWKGLFLPDYESSEADEDLDHYGSSDDSAADVEFYDHYSEDLDDLEHAEMALALGLNAFPPDLTRNHFYASSESEEGSASESDGDEEGEEEGEGEEEEEEEEDPEPDATFSLPRWEPPRHVVESENVPSAMWKMQRRGCTPRLIAMFNMRYNHDEGLIAQLSSLDPDSWHGVTIGRNRLYLGWNIEIDSEVAEVEGEAEKAYIRRQLRDIWRHPERWMVTERHGYPGRGIMDARRLAPVEEDAEMYDTSDSEAYSNGEEYL